MLREALRQARADIIVTFHFDQILSAETLAAVPFGGVNLHPSLLPHHRGPVPTIWARAEVPTRFGVTVHRLAPRIDAGAILAQRAVALAERSTASAAARALHAAGVPLLASTLHALAGGAAPARRSSPALLPLPVPRRAARRRGAGRAGRCRRPAGRAWRAGMTSLSRLTAAVSSDAKLSACAASGQPPRRFLFLQGPISPFFAEVAAGLRALGHATFRINLCLGDRLFWRGGEVAEFHGRPAEWPGFIGDFLDREAITDLVLLGEQRPRHREAIAAARARGIAVTVTDFGYLRPDWVVLERDGMGPASRFPRSPEAIGRWPRPVRRPTSARASPRASLQARWDMAFHLASLLPWRFRHYESWLLHSPIPAYLGTGLRLLLRRRATRQDRARIAALAGHGPLYLFAMQMENDFSIRAYSRFDDNDSAIAEVVGSFARGAAADAHLLVKVHPLDPGLKRWGRRIRRIAAAAGVAGRVHFLGGAADG
ncbi:formyltransferase family protein [Siccirubricoccus deserti]